MEKGFINKSISIASSDVTRLTAKKAKRKEIESVCCDPESSWCLFVVVSVLMNSHV